MHRSFDIPTTELGYLRYRNQNQTQSMNISVK